MNRSWFLLVVGLIAQQSAPNPSSVSTSVSTSVSSSIASYLDIVARYRAGASEEAVEALAAHKEAHSPGFVTGALEQADPEITNPYLEQFPLAKKAACLALAPLLPAAAVLHLETGQYLLQNADEKRGLGHLMAARTIADGKWWTTVPTILPDRIAHFAEVRHGIYRGIMFALQQHHQFEALLPHLERAREQFPDDAQIRLAQGTLDELRSTAIMLRQVELPKKENPSASWRRKQRREYLDKAAAHYRDALTIDSSLVEARVRLGRVLQESGRLSEARRELEAALSVAAPPPPPSAPSSVQPRQPLLPAQPARKTQPAIVQYFASMFLGEVLEAQGDGAAAIARYRETVARWPECQSAQIALSRAFEAAGDRRAAAEALRPLWRAESDRKCLDPWWVYNNGQAWRMPPLVDGLRGRVKGSS